MCPRPKYPELTSPGHALGCMHKRADPSSIFESRISPEIGGSRCPGLTALREWILMAQHFPKAAGCRPPWQHTKLVHWSQQQAGRMADPCVSKAIGVKTPDPPAHSPCSIPGAPLTLEGAIASRLDEARNRRAHQRQGKRYILVTSERLTAGDQGEYPRILCHVIDHMLMRQSRPQSTGSGLRRACVRGCGSSNLDADLDLLHASIKIRSSFADC